MLTTVGFPVVQFNVMQQPLMAVRIVPKDEAAAQYASLEVSRLNVAELKDLLSLKSLGATFANSPGVWGAKNWLCR